MIAGRDAVETARRYIGTPYEEMDCNALIINVIRNSPNGNKAYRCQGTNWLFQSFSNRGKYQYITTRDKIAVDYSNCGIGSIVLKYNEKTGDCSHCGIYAGNGIVIHSPHRGKTVCETTIAKSGFNYVATSKFIEPEFPKTINEKVDVSTGQTTYDREILNNYIDQVYKLLDEIRREVNANGND